MSKTPIKRAGGGPANSNDNDEPDKEADDDAREPVDEADAEALEAAAADYAAEAAEEEQEQEEEQEEEEEPDPEEQIAELRDQLLRVMAESENVRRRAQRDVEDASKYSVSSFARDVLTIGDNLARALDAVPEDAREGNEALTALLDGVTMTQREFLTTIERHGIKQVDPKGEKFDHNFHQAMFEVEDGANDPGTVVQVVQVGYVIGERLLRPAMVGIAKAPAKSGPGGESGTRVDTKV